METVLILCVILAVVLFLVGAAMWYVKKHKAEQHCDNDSNCKAEKHYRDLLEANRKQEIFHVS